MIFFGVVPLLAAIVLARSAPAAAARMEPRTAAVTLMTLCVVDAFAAGLVFSMIGVLGVAEMFPLVTPPDWSVHVLRRVAPLPAGVSIVCAIVVAGLALNACRHAIRVVQSLRTSHRAAARLTAHGELAIATDDAPYAYALPGRPGRIVASTALLRTLSAEQRKALLAHERSHLRHGHFVYLQLVRLSAAANPVLRPVIRVVEVALERWADADAVAAVGDTRIVAHAIGAASLHPNNAPAGALAAGGNAVVERVRFLVEPPSRWRSVTWLLVLVAVLCCAGAGVTALEVHTIVEAAESIR